MSQKKGVTHVAPFFIATANLTFLENALKACLPARQVQLNSSASWRKRIGRKKRAEKMRLEKAA